MGNKGPVRYRKYTEEFKVEAVRLAEPVGIAAARYTKAAIAAMDVRGSCVICEMAG
jgi:transposase-like protein